MAANINKRVPTRKPAIPARMAATTRQTHREEAVMSLSARSAHARGSKHHILADLLKLDQAFRGHEFEVTKGVKSVRHFWKRSHERAPKATLTTRHMRPLPWVAHGLEHLRRRPLSKRMGEYCDGHTLWNAF